MNNLLTDIAGVRVGHADDKKVASGATAVIFDRPAVAAIDVRGGGPGTREGGVLDLANTVEGIDAIALAGGSAFGLEAGGGVQAWLAEQGRGFAVGDAVVPIMPGAIMFDLLNGGDKAWGRFAPYRELGYAAAAAAAADFALGSVGAGLGATTANFKGGLGSASAGGPGGDPERHPGRGAGGGQCRRQHHGRRWAMVLGSAVRNGWRIWRPRIAAVIHAGDAGHAHQGRRCCDICREHDAGGGRHRRRID